MYMKDSRKDGFMFHATTTGVNPFLSWAAVKQVLYVLYNDDEMMNYNDLNNVKLITSK